MNKTKYFLALMLMSLSIAWAPISLAHGLPRSVHGGKTATQLDLGFEIFLRGKEIVVYVTDHDSPFSTEVFTGHVKVENHFVMLKSASGGLMVGKAPLKKLNLSRSVVTLEAAVLPAPLQIDFGSVKQ